MTDAVSIDDLSVPDTMVDTTTGKVWRVEDVDVTLTVSVIHPESDRTVEDAPRFSYPLTTLLDKCRRGDLRDRAAQDDTEDTATESWECDECGETFESAQALAGHTSVHAPD
jgi:hypothetical protein